MASAAWGSRWELGHCHPSRGTQALEISGEHSPARVKNSLLGTPHLPRSGLGSDLCPHPTGTAPGPPGPWGWDPPRTQAAVSRNISHTDGTVCDTTQGLLLPKPPYFSTSGRVGNARKHQPPAAGRCPWALFHELMVLSSELHPEDAVGTSRCILTLGSQSQRLPNTSSRQKTLPGSSCLQVSDHVGMAELIIPWQQGAPGAGHLTPTMMLRRDGLGIILQEQHSFSF